MKLKDFANKKRHLVIFYTRYRQVGETVLGHANFPIKEDWLELEGKEEEDGWHWDGKCDVTDFNGNALTKMFVYCDEDRWRFITKEKKQLFFLPEEESF